MRILALAILIIGIISVAGESKAQTYDPTYPVCMHVTIWGGSYEDCKYYTIAQCGMSASGRGATCNMNPFYAGGVGSPRRERRRHRSVY